MITLFDHPQIKVMPTEMQTVQRVCAFIRAQAGKPPPPFDFRPRGEVIAYVNHGRWVADCPFCASAMLCVPHDPYFWCVECGNYNNQDAPMAVVFPANWPDIEQTLEMRRDARNQNWKPPETVDELVQENNDHGVRGIYMIPGGKVKR
jgi:hypothetical protein